RVVVLIGDVAALHDVGGILDASRQGTSMTLVVPNNDGGGIFSFLPIRSAIDPAEFDYLFHTPHGTSFEFLANHHGISHEHVDAGSIDAAITASFGSSDVTILEANVSTGDRLAIGNAITSAVEKID
ncbi:MAG: hypothetical protein ACR2P0_00790, partial [Acidimicrobiales bacterium]